MTLSKELQALKAESRRLRERQRLKVRPFVKGRPRGRPITHSGTYFTRPVLLDDATMLKVRKNRMPGEPLGSVIRRLIGIAEQKKAIAPIEWYEPEPDLNDPEQYKRIWKEIQK